ncbi:MAG TPA: hypothetical protein VHZ55_06375 [Bryobacteraceae bacterium]|jgi:hypothetical protein|nr:hypothetical protein [Bryobacteraceae bacterium]
MFTRRIYVLLCVLLVGATVHSQAAELKSESISAWEAFVESKEAHLARCPPHSLAEAAEAAELHEGAILIRPARNNGSFSVPSALIHDWVGTVFIPDMSLQDVVAAVRSYDDYPQFYKPSVASVKMIDSRAESDHYSMIMLQDVLTIRTALAGEFVSEYHQIDPAHGYSLTRSCRLQEINKNQELLNPGEGSGFIWRIYSEVHYEQADGGVYLQLEAAALSRTVPRALAWAVNPIVEKISRSALTTTLRQTRDAVRRETASR